MHFRWTPRKQLQTFTLNSVQQQLVARQKTYGAPRQIILVQETRHKHARRARAALNARLPTSVSTSLGTNGMGRRANLIAPTTSEQGVA